MSVQYKSFEFSPFAENTYVIWDDSKECVILDPGCYDHSERMALKSFIVDQGLRPVKFFCTHAHIDHVFGAHFVHSEWNLTPTIHPSEKQVLQYAEISSMQYGLNLDPLPEFDTLTESEGLSFGNSKGQLFFTPGHSPGSLSLYFPQDNLLFSGDVLFRSSIGRTDLPGGDMNTLLQSIKHQLFNLPDDVVVLSGHGPETKIGVEKIQNPFLQGI